MNFFESVLTIATLTTFVFWVIHKYFFTNRAIDSIQSFFWVLFLVLFIRSFLFEPFRIPSSSMRPTLEIGDFILVNKNAYGIRLPVLRTKVVEVDEPQRGDIIVFKYPIDPKTDYIKRVIGIPGDKIAIRGKDIYINDELVVTTKIGTHTWTDRKCNEHSSNVLTSGLPGKSHKIMYTPGDDKYRNGVQVIPKNKYFVMGDNRDHSSDSRFWGFVDDSLIVGRAQLIWFNVDLRDDCANGVQFERIGSIESS